jgi:hypothetical protein
MDYVSSRYMYLNTTTILYTHPNIFVNEISSPPLTLTLMIILYYNVIPLTIVSKLMMA